MCGSDKKWTWLGILLILATGIIHVIDAPDSFHDAAYKGWLFYANGAAAAVAAFGIFRHRCWGWVFGLLIAVGSVIGYIASRTVGLPMIPAEPDAWFEPLGVAAMSAEIAFIAVAFIARSRLMKDGQGAVCPKS